MRAEEIHRRLAGVVNDEAPVPQIITKHEAGAFVLGLGIHARQMMINLQYGSHRGDPEIYCRSEDLRELTRLVVGLFPEWVDDLVPDIQAQTLVMRDRETRTKMHAKPAAVESDARHRPVLRRRKE